MAFDFNWQGYKKAIENEFTIIDKNKLEVPFTLNLAQNHFMENAQERNVILKARKMGFSSVLLALASLKFIFGRNERCVSMSFDATASTKQLERAKHYIRAYEIKESIRRSMDFKIPMKYNSKKEMVYEGIDPITGRPFMNTLRIGTAKTDSFGRGDDITFLHLTEVSQADHLEDLLAGVGEAMVNDSMVTLETTANGYNEFKTFWDEAVLGLRDYNALFYSPEWEYTPEFLEKKKMQLRDKFPQEYPLTPEEAFLASGRPYFEKAALAGYQRQTKEPM